MHDKILRIAYVRTCRMRGLARPLPSVAKHLMDRTRNLHVTCQSESPQVWRGLHWSLGYSKMDWSLLHHFHQCCCVPVRRGVISAVYCWACALIVRRRPLAPVRSPDEFLRCRSGVGCVTAASLNFARFTENHRRLYRQLCSVHVYETQE